MGLLSSLAVLLSLGTPAIGVPSDMAVRWSYLHPLSDFLGTVSSEMATLAYDRESDEVFVVNPGDRSVRIFNHAGMETYDFGDDDALGIVQGVAVIEDAGLVVLSRFDTETALLRCNFRGQVETTLTLKGVPGDFAEAFRPDTLVASAGKLYLLDRSTYKLLVTDTRGVTLASRDLWALAGMEAVVREKKEKERRLNKASGWQTLEDEAEQDREVVRANNDISGFAVDPFGNLFFTVATQFAGFRITPSGESRRIGEPGSLPGRFNIAGAVAADEQGNFYIADRLRAVVMVFDTELVFRGEFGHAGSGPSNLSQPHRLVAGNGKVYVSQGSMRGVSVFAVSQPPVPEAPEPEATPEPYEPYGPPAPSVKTQSFRQAPSSRRPEASVFPTGSVGAPGIFNRSLKREKENTR